MINHVKTGGLMVIIADDDLAVRASLQFALEVEGFTVHVYGTGEELLESDMPTHGCLVLDYNMPGLNGLQLLDRLRARGHDLPAILITSNPSPSTRKSRTGRNRHYREAAPRQFPQRRNSRRAAARCVSLTATKLASATRQRDIVGCAKTTLRQAGA